jgi:hypothetical protein
MMLLEKQPGIMDGGGWRAKGVPHPHPEGHQLGTIREDAIHKIYFTKLAEGNKVLNNAVPLPCIVR